MEEHLSYEKAMNPTVEATNRKERLEKMRSDFKEIIWGKKDLNLLLSVTCLTIDSRDDTLRKESYFHQREGWGVD